MRSGAPFEPGLLGRGSCTRKSRSQSSLPSARYTRQRFTLRCGSTVHAINRPSLSCDAPRTHTASRGNPAGRGGPGARPHALANRNAANAKCAPRLTTTYQLPVVSCQWTATLYNSVNPQCPLWKPPFGSHTRATGCPTCVSFAGGFTARRRMHGSFGHKKQGLRVTRVF